MTPVSTETAVPAEHVRTGHVVRHEQRDCLVVRTHFHRRLGEVMIELADPGTPGFTTLFLPRLTPVLRVGAA